MELVPLPTSNFPTTMVYWNPDTGEMVGEQVSMVQGLIQNALSHGLSGDMVSVELSDPYRKPSELAAILSQYYLVVPEPVSEAPVFVQPSSTVN
jgi:hypothetical protein